MVPVPTWVRVFDYSRKEKRQVKIADVIYSLVTTVTAELLIATVVCNICMSISIGLRQLLGLGDYEVVDVKEWHELEQTAGTNTNRRRQLHGCIQATAFVDYGHTGRPEISGFEMYVRLQSLSHKFI